MMKVNVPEHYNYIGIFLTLGCNLSCSYCINHLVGLNQRRKHLNASQWIEAINRIDIRNDLPISFQGGEPTIHPGFYEIVKGIEKRPIDLLTNLQFDTTKFMQELPAHYFVRDLPYPSIRVSYHPETMELEPLLQKIKILKNNDYPIGLYSVDHPDSQNDIIQATKRCQEEDILFKTKEFLGEHNGKIYGNYHYEDSCFSKQKKNCLCKTSELLISPEGDVFRCHHDLYNKILPIGHILNPNYMIEDIFRECSFYGNCNPCDVKRKNNRFQIFGHASVEIKEIT